MEWCEEKYQVRFDAKDRRDFAMDDPVYNASQLVTAWLDPDAFVEMGGAPLGAVMDMLGYSGDRSGLVESSMVTEALVSGDGLQFTVVDNFSDFDICHALADRLGVDFSVDVKYRFSEGENMEHESDWQHHEVRCRKSVVNELQDVIGKTLSEFGLDEGLETVPVVSSFPAADWRIESFGPASDSINLVSDWSTEESQAKVSLHLSDVTDVRSLEVLLRLAKDNYERLSESSMRASLMVDVGSGEELTGTRAYVSEMLQRLDAYVDSLTDGEGWNEDTSRIAEGIRDYLEGDGSHVKSVEECLERVRSLCGDNPWMHGFVDEAEVLAGVESPDRSVGDYELTPEDAVEIARHAALAGGGETDWSGEVQMELEHGASPLEALREWDVEVPEDYLEKKDVKYVQDERASMLEELYGSSAAYQNVSEYMTGFDLDFQRGRKDYLGKARVEDILMAYCPAGEGHDYKAMAAQVRSDIRNGKTPYEAFDRFGVKFTPDMYEQRPDRLDFRYDGDVMLSFTKAPRLGHDIWELAEEDRPLLDMFRSKTGMDLGVRLGLDGEPRRTGFSSVRLVGSARDALLTPQNREAVRDAEARYTRKYRQQEAYERFNRPLAPVRKGKGVK